MRNRRELGAACEKRVAEYLADHGYTILEQNFYCRFGEIDLICTKDNCLVFVEVKYRSGDAYGMPAEAVDRGKQRRISNTASCYLYRHALPADTPCRFDVAAVSAQSIEIIENAFYYLGFYGR